MLTNEQYFNFVIIWTIMAIVLFPVLLKVTVPYGRHSKTSWGPMIDNKFAWFFMELPALGVFLFFILTGDTFNNYVAVVISALWIFHYSHRIFVFSFQIKTKGKKMPVTIMSLALIFNFINAYIIGFCLANMCDTYEISYFYDVRFILGVSIFVFGKIINIRYDNKLIKLRKNNDTGYSIPYGKLFNKVSCPNLMGEIIEWCGFAIIAWNLPTLSFFIWTFVNLFPRALDHHKWYKSKFEDYPMKRKAVFPYIL